MRKDIPEPIKKNHEDGIMKNWHCKKCRPIVAKELIIVIGFPIALVIFFTKIFFLFLHITGIQFSSSIHKLPFWLGLAMIASWFVMIMLMAKKINDWDIKRAEIHINNHLANQQ